MKCAEQHPECRLCAFAGVNMDQGRPAEGPNSNQNVWDIQLARLLQVQPVLLNKQDDTAFALAKTASKDFSRRVQINTVGGKGSVKIKVTKLLGQCCLHHCPTDSSALTPANVDVESSCSVCRHYNLGLGASNGQVQIGIHCSTHNSKAVQTASFPHYLV